MQERRLAGIRRMLSAAAERSRVLAGLRRVSWNTGTHLKNSRGIAVAGYRPTLDILFGVFSNPWEAQTMLDLDGWWRRARFAGCLSSESWPPCASMRRRDAAVMARRDAVASGCGAAGSNCRFETRHV